MAIENGQVVSAAHDVVMDQGRHPLGKLGFVLLATEQTVMDDMNSIVPDGVGVHFARVSNPDSITNETLRAIGPDLPRVAATLLPDGSLDVVSYACTSGSLVLGEDTVHRLLNQGAPSAKASCIIAAVIRAIRAVGAKRIAVLTPYLDEVNTAEYQYLADAGIECVTFEGMNLEKDSDMVRVSPHCIRDLAVAVDDPSADAIFVSCGALRSVDVIDEIEKICNKPVVTSNQALAWDAIRLAGIGQTVKGYGRLLSDPAIVHG